jgi:hypothetical protein
MVSGLVTEIERSDPEMQEGIVRPMLLYSPIGNGDGN